MHQISIAGQSFLSFACTEISDADHHKILAKGLDWPSGNFGGTIFLDEIGLLPTELQAAMSAWIDMSNLRERPIRLIAASRHPLDELVAKGQFDPVLYNMMDKLIIPTKALARRQQDIRALISAIWASNHIALPPSLSQSAWHLLETHSWIGNFVELQRIAQIIAVAHGGKKVGPDHIKRLLALRSFRHIASRRTETSGGTEISPLNLNAHLEREEAIMLMAALERAGGLVHKAAKLAGINKELFRKKMLRYGIAPA